MFVSRYLPLIILTKFEQNKPLALGKIRFSKNGTYAETSKKSLDQSVPTQNVSPINVDTSYSTSLLFMCIMNTVINS